jgi:hypothetical protein
VNAATAVALAGRRIDPAEAQAPRFPLGNAATVCERLRITLIDQRARALVCSAACGTDLLGLEAAGTLGLRRVIVLPFAVERFRSVSVVDRPGEWGPLFDRMVAEVGAAGDLIVLPGGASDEESFAAANERILDEAGRLGGSQVRAMVAWEGAPRGTDDATAAFLRAARARGYETIEISTR